VTVREFSALLAVATPRCGAGYGILAPGMSAFAPLSVGKADMESVILRARTPLWGWSVTWHLLTKRAFLPTPITGPNPACAIQNKQQAQCDRSRSGLVVTGAPLASNGY